MNYLGRILIISGDKNTGKTFLCRKIIRVLKKKKVLVKGVISLGCYIEEKKSRIDVEDIFSDEKRTLARFSPGWDAENPIREWLFDQKNLEWGNELLRKSIPADVLIIDELGYLELEKHLGWTNAFNVLGSKRYHLAIIVIRSGLVEKAEKLWPDSEIIDLNIIQDENQIISKIINVILEFLEIDKQQSPKLHLH